MLYVTVYQSQQTSADGTIPKLGDVVCPLEGVDNDLVNLGQSVYKRLKDKKICKLQGAGSATSRCKFYSFLHTRAEMLFLINLLGKKYRNKFRLTKKSKHFNCYFNTLARSLNIVQVHLKCNFYL